MPGRSESIRRRAAAALVAAAALTALAMPTALRLELETDLLALLPSGERAAVDYARFAADFASLQKVYLLVRAAEPPPGTEPVAPAELAAVASELAEALEASPEVERARSGLEPADQEFFSHWVAPQAPLLLEPESHAAIEARLEPGAIAARARRIRADLLSPLGGTPARLAVTDPFGWSGELFERALAGTGLTVDPATAAFLSADGKAALVVVTPTVSEIDPESGRRLAAEIDRAAAAARTGSAAWLEVAAAGGPLYAAADERIVRTDLERTLMTSLVACAALLALAFDGFVVPALVLGALPVALVWTAAALAGARGSLSAVALGFAAVLVGLGVDYAIHGAARWRQQPSGTDGAVALVAAYRGAGPGILVSAATTAAAFSILALSSFRPLREVGIAVALGIVAMLAAAATAGCLLAWRRHRPASRERWLWSALGRSVAWAGAVGRRHRVAVLSAAAIATAVGATGAARLTIDPRLDVLRPSDHPVLAAEAELVESFGVELDTTAVLLSGATLGEALEGAGAAERAVRLAVGSRVETASPRHWLVAGEERRRRLEALSKLPIERAANEMAVALAEVGLDPRAFALGLDAARRIGRGEDPGMAPREAWPAWLGELIHIGPGTITAALYLRLPEGAWPEGPPPEVVAAIDGAAPRAAVASAPALGSAMRRLAASDLRVLGLAALGVVGLVVAISFRGRPVPAAMALMPVALGTLWTLGGWALAGQRLDLVTVLVLPVLLGIGIDDGLHLIHAREADLAGGMPLALERTGRAIALTTLTTAAGFGSLTLSSLPGLAAAGLLLALGVLACLLATVLILPALERSAE